MSLDNSRRNVRQFSLPRVIRLAPLFAIIFFTASGGPYGMESVLSTSGVGVTLILLCLIPLFISLPMALMSAELGAALPLEGGYYSWVKVACGQFAGFMSGVISWIASWLDTALYPLIFVDYLSVWFPSLTRGKGVAISLFGGNFSIDRHWLCAVLLMVAIALLQAQGFTFIEKGTTRLMGIVLFPLLIFILLACYRFTLHPHTSFFSSLTLPHQSVGSSAGAGLAIILWSYIGYDAVSTSGSEIKEPSTFYPKALFTVLPLIVLSYLLPIIAAVASGLHAGSPTHWADGDFANAANLVGGHWLKGALVVSAVASQVGIFSSYLFCMSRLPFILAADKYLPDALAKITPRRHTPINAIALSTAIYSLFAAFTFATLLNSEMVLALVAILLEFIALVFLRYRFPGLTRPFKIKGGGWGLVAVCLPPSALTIWLLINTYQTQRLAFWLGVGLICFAAGMYLVLNRYMKQGQPDADFGLSAIDFGNRL